MVAAVPKGFATTSADARFVTEFMNSLFPVSAAGFIFDALVQIGYQRGGLYSHDWLDRLFGNLACPSATRILTEFQHLAVGDHIPVGRGPRWPVAVLEPD